MTPKAMSIVAAALVSTLAAASLAQAKSLCITDGFGDYIVIPKAKIPKKPGQAAQLNGLFIGAGVSSMVTGAIARRGDNTLMAGVHRYGVAPPAGDLSISWFADEQLQGSLYFDSDGDFSHDDVTGLVFTSIDCKTVTIP